MNLARTQTHLKAALSFLMTSLCLLINSHAATDLDLTRATVVIRSGTLPAAEANCRAGAGGRNQKAHGLTWPISTIWPTRGVVIALSSTAGETGWPKAGPRPAEMMPPSCGRKAFASRSKARNHRIQPFGFQVRTPVARCSVRPTATIVKLGTRLRPHSIPSRPRHRARPAHSRPSTRLSAHGQQLRRLGRKAIRTVHPRTGPVRREQR